MRMGRILFCSLAVSLGLLDGPARAGAAVAATAQATPAAVRVTADRANVREGASTTATVIATMNKGDELTVVGTSGTWYRVRLRTSNREGYIAMSTVEAVRAAPAPGAAAPATPATPPAAAPAPRPAAPPAQPAPRPAAAQAARPRPAARQAASTPWGVRGFIGADGFAPAATKTFSALLGTDSFSGLTAGADVYGGALPFGLFARVGFSKFSGDGERVFVVGGQSFGTGIPLTVKITPVQIGGGIRFRLGQNARTPSFVSRLTPYAGAGVVLLTYQEVSDFADDGDNDAEKFKGLSIFGGLDVNIMKYVSAGVEVEFRQISGFATGGVAAEFDEDQLGGTSVKFLIGIGR